MLLKPQAFELMINFFFWLCLQIFDVHIGPNIDTLDMHVTYPFDTPSISILVCAG